MIDALLTDARDVLRSLQRQRVFALTAAVTFALGLGANVAVFSIIDRLMFRPLPYSLPDRLVQIHSTVSLSPTFSAAQLPFEIADMLSNESRSLSGIGWVEGYAEQVFLADGQNSLSLVPVTANALDVLGVRPVIGSGLSAVDQGRGSPRQVMLTNQAWRGKFGASPSVVGTLWSSGLGSYRVVGVLPADFLLPSSHFMESIDGLTVMNRGRLGVGSVTIAPFARLGSGVSTNAAQAEVAILIRRHEWSTPTLRQLAATEGVHVAVVPLRDGLSLLVKSYLWIVSSAVWIVLAVGCVNLSTLLVARARARQQEAAIRAALGASPGRLVRHAVVEASVLCGIGGMAALLVCYLTHQAVLAVIPPSLRGFAVTPLDWRIVAIAGATIVVCAAGVSVLPALVAAKVNLLSVLQRGGRATRSSGFRVGSVLLVLESYLGVVLVFGAGATVPRFAALLLRPPGFDASDLYVLNVGHDWPTGVHVDRSRVARAKTITDIIRGTPRVVSVSAAVTMPFESVTDDGPFWERRGMSGDEWAIAPDLFETLRTPLRSGRSFSVQEVIETAPVAILNESAVRALWPGISPSQAIGRTVATSADNCQIVGVVGDVRTHPGATARSALFLPIAAEEVSMSQTALSVLVRMAPGAIPDRSQIASRLNAVFPPNAISVQSVAAHISPWLERPRFIAILLGTLALVALGLAAVGLYAVVSLEAAEKRYEMALRLALGATPGHVRRRIFALSLLPVGIGSLLGLISARTAATMLVEGASPSADFSGPWIPAASAAIMMLTAIVAAWAPARRVSRADLVTQVPGW